MAEPADRTVTDPQTFLFDLYGVLIRDHGSAQFERVARAVGEPEKNERLHELYEQLRPDLDAGRVSELNYWNQIALRVGLTDLDAQEVITADYRGLHEGDAAAIEFLLGLKAAGHRVGVLSNAPPGLAKLVREHHSGWLEQLDAVLFSCEIGAAKPEPMAFHLAVQALGVEAGEIIFIDDRPVNVAAARAEGLRAIHYTTLDDLKEQLP